MRSHRPGEPVPRHGDVAERDRNGGSVTAVALEVLGAPDESQDDAGADVREDGQADEEGFGDRGLVDLAGEEEVGFGGGDGARDERDEGGRGEVEGCEDGEGVGGVALNAGYWDERVSWRLGGRGGRGTDGKRWRRGLDRGRSARVRSSAV